LLFAGECGFIGWITAVQREGRFQAAFESRRALVVLILLVRPRTESPVERAVAVEEKGGEGEIVIELEERKVDRIGVDHAHTDEFVEQRR